ncbi:ribosome rescue protein RqcH [Caldiplasma sukawensis]
MDLRENSLEIHGFVSIYGNLIRGSFFKKIYRINENIFIFQFHSTDVKKGSLYVDLRRGICLKDVERGNEPDSLTMYLRKIFSDKKISDIRQINFDRVLRIDTFNGYSIVFEMFREGNLIILNDNIIEFALNQKEWKNRKIIKGEMYIPPTLNDPLTMEDEKIAEIFRSSKGSIVQTMATRLNLGGQLSEEILYKTGINKDEKPLNLIEKISLIRSSFIETIKLVDMDRGYVYGDNLTPILMKHIQSEPDKIFESFNAGLSEFMDRTFEEEKDTKTKAEKIMESQKKTMETYEKLAYMTQQIGEFISSNFSILNQILKNSIKMKPGEKINTTEGEMELVEFDGSKKILKFSVNDKVIELNLKKSIGENMNIYFEKSKEYRNKIEGIKEAIKKQMENEKIEEKKRKVQRQKFWFEAYHWFFTESDLLVIAGKNTDTNEKVVKKHLSDHDIYVHADMYGAPSTVIKSEGKEIREQDIIEAAKFSVSFSRAWQNGLVSSSAYWVYPVQVSKTPESGEYVRKGSWVIRGQRNYMFELPLKLSVKKITYKGVEIPMIYPYREGENDCVTIIPGNEKREKVAEIISKRLELDRDEIFQILPNGGSRIL